MRNAPPNEPQPDALARDYQNSMAAGSAACPGDETLAELVLGELSGAARLAVADHVITCRACAEHYRILRQLHGEARAKQPPRTFARQPAAWLAAAAVVLAALGLVWLAPWQGGVGPPSELLRGGTESSALVRPADGSVLGQAPDTLNWPAQLGALSYEVSLYDAEAELLWQAPPVSDTQVALPRGVKDTLIPGRDYFWTVTIEGPTARQRLGPFWFHVEE